MFVKKNIKLIFKIKNFKSVKGKNKKNEQNF